MKHANVLLAICVGLVSLSAARAADPILIGEISSMSGPLAVGGVPGRQGAIMAVEEINQKGGVLGRPLQLVMRDDKTQPEEAGKAFRELAAQGVLLAMGTTGSATTAAMKKYTARGLIRKVGTATPGIPLSPPVSPIHLYAVAHEIWATASVTNEK